MVEDKEKSLNGDHDRLLVIEERVRNIDAKTYDIRKLTDDMSVIKDAVVRLTVLQEKMQEESVKRDREFIEYSANAERQWKKIAKNDVAFERLSVSFENLNKSFCEYKQSEEERIKIERQHSHELHKNKMSVRWALITAVVATILGAIGTIVAALLK